MGGFAERLRHVQGVDAFSEIATCCLLLLCEEFEGTSTHQRPCVQSARLSAELGFVESCPDVLRNVREGRRTRAERVYRQDSHDWTAGGAANAVEVDSQVSTARGTSKGYERATHGIELSRDQIESLAEA